MVDGKKKKLEEKLQAHRQAFTARLPEKLKQMEEIWYTLVKERWSLEMVSNLHRIVHSLAGSSGTFGLPLVGEAAYQLEIPLFALVKVGKAPTEQQCHEVQQCLNALLTITQESLSQSEYKRTPLPERATAAFASDNRAKQCIYVVESDETIAKNIAAYIRCFGYSVQTMATLAAFRKNLEQSDPAIIIMAMVLPDGDVFQTMIEIQKSRIKPLPVVFLGNDDALQTRLRAVEAGGQACCPKPVDLSLLMDILDRMNFVCDPEPYRVVIMDESNSMSEYYAMVLKNAGMEPRVVSKPIHTLKPLQALQPELILLDLHMSQCSCVALAAAIRQQELFVTVPILFLLNETDGGKSFATISTVADGFLQKPIKPDHLIQVVSTWVERYRKLCSLMNSDSLTGLLGHARIKERLAMEVKRSKRKSGVVSFAMVDIDAFKQINDTYGYLVGDGVIKSLSRLLKQGLGRKNSIGRLSGKTFAVILADRTALATWEILDRLRKEFGRMAQQHKSGVFYATFSCGVASFPAYADGTSLHNAANRALSVAKIRGRNRVETASGHR